MRARRQSMRAAAHFLSRGAWNHDLARDRLAVWVAAELTDNEAVLIVDETGDEKSSTDCVGACHQYSGALGGVGLCQVAVHLTYASPRGHALIDRELYLPAAWAEDEERRLLRHVPDEVTFATKPQLAAATLHRARQRGLPARWFTGDEVYGSLELRRTARTLGFDYALAVKADHRASTAVGRFSATEPAAKVPARAWMRRRTGNGTNGDRHYDWALIDVLADAPRGPGRRRARVPRHAPSPLYPRTVLLPLPLRHPRQPRGPREHHLHPLEDRGGLPRREGPARTRPGPGDLLDLRCAGA
ncbi:IS701 family transposase [Streptomyces sp. NPDC046931]|uniref:IS701 family transposase n=1 Tax=Streptomyces sp. NPDC046931 TaxID=3154806 RepID=UPI0033F2CB68